LDVKLSLSSYDAQEQALGTLGEFSRRIRCPLCRLVTAALYNGPHRRTIDRDESIVIGWIGNRKGFVFKSLGKDVMGRMGRRIVYVTDEKRTFELR
jgi:hypothetical protein